MSVNYLELIDNALRAGAAALRQVEDRAIRLKQDGSPVTEADLAVAAAIHAALPGQVVIDEESFDPGNPIDWHDDKARFLVDPIAGTSCYINHLPFYAMVLGVIEDGRPVAGGVYFPALDELYLGDCISAYRVLQPFSDQPQRTYLTKPCSPQQDIIGHHGSRRLRAAFDLDELAALWLCIPTINIHMAYLLTGRLSAALCTPMLWDISGIWPILKACSADFYDAFTGAAVEMVSDSWVDVDLCVSMPLFACARDAKDDIFKRLQEWRRLPKD